MKPPFVLHRKNIPANLPVSWTALILITMHHFNIIHWLRIIIYIIIYLWWFIASCRIIAEVMVDMNDVLEEKSKNDTQAELRKKIYHSNN